MASVGALTQNALLEVHIFDRTCLSRRMHVSLYPQYISAHHYSSHARRHISFNTEPGVDYQHDGTNNRGGAPCLLGLVLQELCSSLFLFEHVELVVQRLPLVLHFLFLVLVELLQTVELLMQLVKKKT
ncbi:hypothetical protein EYF80_026380 [Liparis tanakae]|uniref:Uncharacterized protein n=1 Tax=Liparis tanakae TaxID=230148 RepID=A0A4Z2HET6_9TELE|nr:hypothetical protein EYF80_026380 [Liparis tanakae]